jgi:uncharacterized protein
MPDLPLPLEDAPRLRIVDAHSHVATVDFMPMAFLEGIANNLATTLAARGMGIPHGRLIDRLIGSLQDADCRQQLAEMELAGISRSILLIPDFTLSPGGLSLTIEEIFLAHRRLLDLNPGRFVAFGGVDPRWGQDGVELFERAVRDWGFAGLKLYPPCGYSPSDERLFPFYEICAARSLPVLLHTGPTSPALSFAYSSPFHVDEAARRFPRVNFILAHGAVHHVEECAMLCEYRPNVYLDISGLQSKLAADRETQHFRHLFWRGINHKILFGTDWPLFRLMVDQQGFLTELLGADGILRGLHAGDRELIFCKNVERLLPAAARREAPPRVVAS